MSSTGSSAPRWAALWAVLMTAVLRPEKLKSYFPATLGVGKEKVPLSPRWAALSRAIPPG